MRSPTTALIWEIWSRNRGSIWAIVGMTVFSWTQDGGGDPAPLVEVLAMISFLILFGVFNYTELSSDKQRSFPYRLFTFPVSSFRLVAVPVFLGIVSVELLYAAWIGRLGGGGSTGSLFVAVLLATFMVVYQAVMWTLAPFGSLRLVAVGLMSVAFFIIGFIPSTARSEAILTVIMAGLAVVVFLAAWMYVARRRAEGGAGHAPALPIMDTVADTLRGRKRGRARAFASPEAAHFWFEWRCAGMPLPALVGGLLLFVIWPLSTMARIENDPGDAFRLLLGTLAMPIVLAIPIGVAFSKPTFWSEDLSVPEFLAVRPLGTGEVVMIKMKVAALSAVASWLLVVAFLSLWLPLWANHDVLVQLESRWGAAVLLVVAAMFVTWRFLVSGLWSGLSGNRRLYFASGAAVVLFPIALVYADVDASWILEDPERLIPLLWIAAIALAIKYAIAARSWSRIGPPHVRRFLLLVWLGGTTYFVSLSVLLWDVLRPALPPDLYRLQGLLILLALLVVPVARLFLAPVFLERNWHR